MNYIKWIVLSIASSIIILLQLITYKTITNQKIKLKIPSIIFIIIGGIFVTANSYNVDSTFRAFLSFAIVFLAELIIFKNGPVRTIIYSIVCYSIVVVTEIVLDILLLSLNLIDLQHIDNNVFIKILLSIIMTFPACLIVRNKIIKKFANKLTHLMEKSILPLIILSIFLIVLIILAFKNVMKISFTSYIGNVALLVIFFVMIFIIFYNYHKAEKEVEKTKVLLEFMVDYEKQIEEDRINRHEMLNNLLILKSYGNKNSKDYNNTLDDLIETYNKKNVGFKNIYKLPSGLKGIIYYKINELKNKNIIFNINISKKLSDSLSKMNYKTYAAVCKIVGITFDNAIEACIESKEKLINFDVYEEDNQIIIDVENTIKNNVDINKINDKNYSTKGKGRGLGLYIVKNIIKNNNDISLEQFSDNNIFVTKIVIKK